MGLRNRTNHNTGANMNNGPNFKLVGALIGGLVGLLVLIGISKQLVGTNNAGFYQVKQAAVTGQMSVIADPGMYGKWFAEITTYQISDMHYFSKNKR